MKITLKAARINAGLTGKDVAKKLGVTIERIRYMEKNTEKIYYPKLLRLCEIYECRPEDILIRGDSDEIQD